MKNYIFIILAAALFGTIGIFIKLIGDSVHPMVINFYRAFFGFVTLLFLCPVLDKKTFKVKKKDLKLYIPIGLMIAITISLTNLAFIFAPVQNVAFIISMFPFFVFIFAYFLLNEKITAVKVIALVIAGVGLFIMNPLRSEGMLGSVLAILSTAVYGLLVPVMRMVDKTHSIGDVFWFFFFAVFFLLPFPFIYGFGDFSVHLIFLGVLSTGIAYLFQNLALEKIEAETSSIILMIVSTMVAVTLALFILEEPFNMQILAGGGLLVLSGIYLQTHRKKLNKIEEEVREEEEE
ncbi:DMT family transporter [Patescibacteria group bacterium]